MITYSSTNYLNGTSTIAGPSRHEVIDDCREEVFDSDVNANVYMAYNTKLRGLVK